MKSRETTGPSFQFRQSREGPVQFRHLDVQVLGFKANNGLLSDESRISHILSQQKLPINIMYII